jgi:hypothetical protein
MLRMLVDTCVWLDLAKTPSQSRNIEILQALWADKVVELIVPQTVIDEFSRNKTRVIDEYAKSISTTLSRAREIVVQQGDQRRIRRALTLFNDAGYKIQSPRELATGMADRIEALLWASTVVAISDEVKLRASDRAIRKLAPFHRDKNSINDAILIESYSAFIRERDRPRDRFAFVTHNYKDFGAVNGSRKFPHPDIAPLFSRSKSRYFIELGEALGSLKSHAVSDWLYENYEAPIRSVSEIVDVTEELVTKIWYDCHQVSLAKIASGKEQIVAKLPDVPWPKRENLIQADILQGALKAAAKVGRRFGRENLGPWSN